MSEKNAKATETVEIDPGMSVMPEGPGPMDVPTVIPELDSVLAAMPSALPAYQTTAWKNKPSTETPVDAAVMTRVEQRLVDLTNAVNALRDSVSQRLLTDVKANEKKISLNDLTKTGLYVAFSPDNAPSTVKGSWVTVINVILANNVNYRSQILWSNNSSYGAWLRNCTSGSWGEWTRL